MGSLAGTDRISMTLNQQVGALYEQLRLDVFRYILALGLPPHMAQDITHDSFIRLYETLPRGAAVENARAWLLQVAHNLAVNAVTSKSFAPSELNPVQATTEYTAEDRLIEAEGASAFEPKYHGYPPSKERTCSGG